MAKPSKSVLSALPGHGEQNPDGKLTGQQRQFVNYVVRDKMPVSAAARLAGYNASAGSALSRNPKIIAAIAAEREEFAIASGISKKDVLDGFLEAIEMAKTKADPLVMVSGWREIGKMCGYYEPTKTELKISVNGKVMLQRFQEMSDQELLQQVQELSAIEGEFDVLDPRTAAAEGVDGAGAGPTQAPAVHEDDSPGV